MAQSSPSQSARTIHRIDGRNTQALFDARPPAGRSLRLAGEIRLRRLHTFSLPPPNRPNGPCRPHQSELDELAPWTTHQFTARTQNIAQIRGPSHQNQPVARAVPTGLQPLAPRLGALGDGEIEWRTCCTKLCLLSHWICT